MPLLLLLLLLLPPSQSASHLPTHTHTNANTHTHTADTHTHPHVAYLVVVALQAEHVAEVAHELVGKQREERVQRVQPAFFGDVGLRVAASVSQCQSVSQSVKQSVSQSVSQSVIWRGGGGRVDGSRSCFGWHEREAATQPQWHRQSQETG
jgi:hypothetical protein